MHTMVIKIRIWADSKCIMIIIITSTTIIITVN